ncbi:hypothetical protein [Corallococcus aberystwythensis]|nr:hypothetical protein [Corallococcus aberystwythensis]
MTSTRTFSEVSTPGSVVFAIDVERGHRARFATHGLETPFIRMKTHSVEEYVSSEISRTEQSDEESEFSLELSVGDWRVPETPGELRFDEKTDSSNRHLGCCNIYCPGPEFSGVLRLTPDMPAFRIVDDSAEQNPIPHCRIRVRGPDGREQEFVTDARGEVFIPRAGNEVYTLLEVLQDEMPLAGALPGDWTVESMPDLP